MKRIAVIGAGSWGTALGIIAARAGHEVKFWSVIRRCVTAINEESVNSIYYADAEIDGVVQRGHHRVVRRSELVIIALRLTRRGRFWNP